MFELPKLPYKLNALEPYISAETMRYHYNKHHAGYVKKLNELTEDTKYANMFLEDLVKELQVPLSPWENKIYDMAGQCYNHEFYWNCMSPNTEQPRGYILEYIEWQYGSLEEFKSKFLDYASTQFGSGWIWLCQNRTSLDLYLTPNAGTIIDSPWKRPVLVCDLWEHSYYLDYKNARERYVKNFLKIINWKFVESRLAI